MTCTTNVNIEEKTDKSEIIKAKKEKKKGNSKKEKKSEPCLKNDSNYEVYEKEKTDTSEIPQKTSEDSTSPWDLHDCFG